MTAPLPPEPAGSPADLPAVDVPADTTADATTAMIPDGTADAAATSTPDVLDVPAAAGAPEAAAAPADVDDPYAVGDMAEAGGMTDVPRPGPPPSRRPKRSAARRTRTAACRSACPPPRPSPPRRRRRARARTKGVADIVFLVDVSGSMQPCLDALVRNIEVFVDSLSRGDANNAAPVKDWRGKVVGYRDFESADSEGLPWIEDHPFVRDAVALKAQLATLRAQGGGDEPESLLDALYTVATMEASPKGAQAEEPTEVALPQRRARVVVVFTDASFKETLQIPQAKGGALQDVANVVMANRIILSLFAPNFEGYDRLSQIDKSEWEVVEYEGLTRRRRCSATRPTRPTSARRSSSSRRACRSRPRRSRSSAAPHGEEAQGRRPAPGLHRHQGVRPRGDGHLVRGAVADGRKIFLKQYKSPAPTVVWYGAFVDYQQELARACAAARRPTTPCASSTRSRSGGAGRPTSRRTSSSSTAATCSRSSTRSATSTSAPAARRCSTRRCGRGT
jgi:hypothetical protein